MNQPRQKIIRSGFIGFGGSKIKVITVLFPLRDVGYQCTIKSSNEATHWNLSSEEWASAGVEVKSKARSYNMFLICKYILEIELIWSVELWFMVSKFVHWRRFSSL